MWYTIIFTVHLFCWYYALAFCGVYINSQSGWIYGSIISLLIDKCIIQMITPTVKTLMRIIFSLCPNMCFIWMFSKYTSLMEFAFYDF